MRHLNFYGILTLNGSPNLGQMTRLYHNKQKKRTCKSVIFAVQADQKIKLNENEKKDKYIDLARELKKTMEPESDVYTNCNWYSWYRHRKIKKGTGGFEN